MSKTKVFGLVALIGGLIALSAGGITNFMLTDQLDKGIPDALTEIRNEASSQIEDEVEVLGIADALLEIKELGYEKLPLIINCSTFSQVVNQTLDGVSDKVQYQANATTAAVIMNGTLDGLTQFILDNNVINATIGAQLIANTLNTIQAQNGTTPTESYEEFFNNETFQSNYSNSFLQGISEFNTGGLQNLSFSPAAQQNILFGNDPVPGIISDLETGQGMLGFMELYLNATVTPASPEPDQYNATMQMYYQTDWDHINYVANYIQNHLWADRVGFYITNVLSTTAEALALNTAKELYMNDANFTTTTQGEVRLGGPGSQTPNIYGISEFWDMITSIGSLNIPEASIGYILYGNLGAPGLISDLEEGTGVLYFLDSYDNATDGENDATDILGMETIYGCSFTNLTAINTYLESYLMYSLTDPAFQSKYGVTLETYADTYARELFFNSNEWWNITGGAAPINGTTQFWYNLNPSITNISYTQTAQYTLLYGGGGYPGLITDTDLGLDCADWLADYEEALTDPIKNQTMQTVYNSTWDQLTYMYQYIDLYIFDNVVPAVLWQEFGVPTVQQYIPYAIYGQWSNVSLTDGEPLDLQVLEPGIGESVTGLEVGYPNSADLTFSQCDNLWDETNEKSLLNRSGIELWKDAYDDDEDTYNDLKSEFSLSNSEIDQILDWLFKGDESFQKKTLPPLFKYDQGVTIPEKADELFFEQWTRGTIEGSEEYPDGLPLTEGDDPVTGVEVGIPDDLDINISVAQAMWDSENKYALTNQEGIEKWYAAANDADSDESTELKDEFGLDDDQMEQITSWLMDFRNNVLPKLAEQQLGFNPTLVQDISFYGGVIGGGVLAALGVVGLILSRRS